MISSQKENAVNTERFINLVRKYTDIQEPTPEIIHEFVERIEIKNIDNDCSRRILKIHIIWNCIGEFLPPVQQKEKTA